MPVEKAGVTLVQLRPVVFVGLNEIVEKRFLDRSVAQTILDDPLEANKNYWPKRP
ncbi:maltose-6'-phosphate glucosidase [Leptospira borgpetersenii serovar Hardjo-bovis]|nr:maltose-6'-phosphate glucosidase [Leptospira borgpetersenii serovar Hardjo-bovis]